MHSPLSESCPLEILPFHPPPGTNPHLQREKYSVGGVLVDNQYKQCDMVVGGPGVTPYS
jgi:hypothetical protein